MSTQILWQGDSLLDGAPVVAIISGLWRPSSNRKTGPMLQTWILRADQTPVEAVKSGDDASICGDCTHRGGNGAPRTCYVNIGQAPQAIYRQFAAGRLATSRELTGLGRGRAVRLGAYGDPAAVPAHIWRELTAQATVVTGYTHQWRSCDPALQALCMASVDSREEAEEAQALGWRTFRVKSPTDLRTFGEAICPASEEAGAKITCLQCGACDGTRRALRGNIVINAHGTAHQKQYLAAIL